MAQHITARLVWGCSSPCHAQPCGHGHLGGTHASKGGTGVFAPRVVFEPGKQRYMVIQSKSRIEIKAFLST